MFQNKGKQRKDITKIMCYAGFINNKEIAILFIKIIVYNSVFSEQDNYVQIKLFDIEHKRKVKLCLIQIKQ